MTISNYPWLNALADAKGPKYKAIAHAILGAIERGELAPGTRLPPQRELAWALKCTVGTVTRAYALVESRGLVAGEVGRGTYVLDPATAEWPSGRRADGGGSNPPTAPSPHLRTMDGISDWRTATGPAEQETGPIALNHDYPPLGIECLEASKSMVELSASAVLADMLSYQPHAGMERHRAAGAAWINRTGLNATADTVVVTGGGHNGVMATLSALTQAGDAIAVEALSYPGIKAIAGLLGLRLLPVHLDEEGLMPEALDALCRRERIVALYTVPTFQNPTNATMSTERRRAIAAVAVEHGLNVIEDDILGMLASQAPPPLCSFLPESLGFYVSSVSKTLAAGLRTGFVHCPPRQARHVAAAIRTSSWMASPFTAEIVTHWIETGSADRILESHLREIAARRSMVMTALDGLDVNCPEGTLHAWLRLPAPWRPGQLVTEALEQEVVLPPSDAFVIGDQDTPRAVRVSFCPPRQRDRLDQALGVIATLLIGNSGRVDAVQVL